MHTKAFLILRSFTDLCPVSRYERFYVIVLAYIVNILGCKTNVEIWIEEYEKVRDGQWTMTERKAKMHPTESGWGKEVHRLQVRLGPRSREFSDEYVHRINAICFNYQQWVPPLGTTDRKLEKLKQIQDQMMSHFGEEWEFVADHLVDGRMRTMPAWAIAGWTELIPVWADKVRDEQRKEARAIRREVRVLLPVNISGPAQAELKRKLDALEMKPKKQQNKKTLQDLRAKLAEKKKVLRGVEQGRKLMEAGFGGLTFDIDPDNEVGGGISPDVNSIAFASVTTRLTSNPCLNAPSLFVEHDEADKMDRITHLMAWITAKRRNLSLVNGTIQEN